MLNSMRDKDEGGEETTPVTPEIRLGSNLLGGKLETKNDDKNKK